MSHLLYTYFLHLEFLVSLFFPCPFIPSYSPFISNLRCQQLPVLYFSLFTPFMTFILPYLVFQFHFFVVVAQIPNFWLQSLSLLSSMGLLHLTSTSKYLSRFSDLCFPLLFVTLYLPFVFGVVAVRLLWCSSPPCAIRESGNTHLGNLFQRGHFTLHFTLDSVFIEVQRHNKCHIHCDIPSLQHNVAPIRFSVNTCSLSEFLRQ